MKMIALAFLYVSSGVSNGAPKAPQPNPRLQVCHFSSKQVQASQKQILQETILPNFEAKNVSLELALDHLKAEVLKHSSKSVNFVIQDPHGKMAKRLVSINLSKIPASEVCAILAEMCSGAVQYQANIVVFKPS